MCCSFHLRKPNTDKHFSIFLINSGFNPREWWYLVHALRNELSLAVDAGEGAVPRHLLERVGNISWRRGAAVCRMGA